MKNLSTQIATTREQSERLLAMGVKPETADLYWMLDKMSLEMESELSIGSCGVVEDKWTKFTPAWSLSRLISMMPTSVPDPKPGFKPHHPELIKHESGYNLSIRRYTADCLVGTHIEKDPIECCVSMVGWLIKNNHFNEEYLKGGKP